MREINYNIDPFVIVTILVLLTTAYTFYNLFLVRNFPTFISEEEIREAIDAEFPYFADYL